MSEVEDDADLDVPTSAPAHVELLQLSQAALAECLETRPEEGDEIVAVLPSQRTLDFGNFIKQSFAALHDDVEAESTPISVFFQFMAVVTSLFDAEQYPALTHIPRILHSDSDLNVDLVEVVIVYVRGLDMSTQRNHTIDALTNISNLFTILMNYIRYELTLEPAQRMLCATLAASDNLIAFVNETVHLIRVRVNNVITVEMRDSFRARLVQFWIALIDNRVLPQTTIDNVVLSFIRHEDVCMVVGHLLSQVEQDQEPALQLFRSLVSSEFVAFLRKDSWRGLREKFLSLAFVKMQNLIARDVLDGTVKAALDVMTVLNEILGDVAFLSLLMSSRVHLDMLMAFFKALVQRSSVLFAPVEILDADDDDEDDEEVVTLKTHQQLLSRFSIALHAFYCRLTQTDKDSFIMALLEAHDSQAARTQLIGHLTDFAALPILTGRQTMSPSNRRAFSGFVTRLRTLSGKTPPPDHDDDDTKTESVPSSETPKLSRLRSSAHKRKLSDLDHYLMQTSFRLTASNVDEVPEAAPGTVPAQLQTLTERFLAGIPNVTVTRRGASGPWALITTRSVKCHEFLVEYTGQRMNRQDLAEADAKTQERIESSGPNSVVRLDGDLVLDASRTGSIARCIAHSCQPSAEIQRWIVAGQPRLFVFSIKEMASGDPVLIDFQAAGIITRPFTCNCGVPSCTNRHVEVEDLPWEGGTPSGSVSAESSDFDNALHALATAAQAEQVPASSSSALKRRNSTNEAPSGPPPKRLSIEPAPGPVYRGTAAGLVRQAQQLASGATRYGPGPTPGFTYAPPRGSRTARSGPDSLLSFNRARGFASRASSHVAIARGIQMHRKAVSGQSTPVSVPRKTPADAADGANNAVHKPPEQWDPEQQQQPVPLQQQPVPLQQQPVQQQQQPVPHQQQQQQQQLYQQYAAMQRAQLGAGQQQLMQMGQQQHTVPALYADVMSKQQQAQQQHMRHVVQMYSRLQHMGTGRGTTPVAQQVPNRLQQQPQQQPTNLMQQQQQQHRLNSSPLSAATQQAALQQQQVAALQQQVLQQQHQQQQALQQQHQQQQALQQQQQALHQQHHQQQQQVLQQQQQAARANAASAKPALQQNPSGDYVQLGSQQALGQLPPATPMVPQQQATAQPSMGQHQLLMQQIPGPPRPQAQLQHMSAAAKMPQMRPMPMQQMRPMMTPIQRQQAPAGASWPMQQSRAPIYVQSPYPSQPYPDNDLVQVQPEMMLQRNPIPGPQMVAHRTLQQIPQPRAPTSYEYPPMMVGTDGRLMYHAGMAPASNPQWTQHQQMLRQQQMQWHMYQQMQRQQQQMRPAPAHANPADLQPSSSLADIPETSNQAANSQPSGQS